MKKIILAFGLMVSSAAMAVCNPFVPGALTASILNSAVASPCITSGTAQNLIITNSPISGSTGSFTTLSTTGTANFASGVNVAGTLSALGNSTVAGTLTASSGVNVAGTLAASSGVNVAGTLAAASAVNVAGTLTVTGSAVVPVATTATQAVQASQVSADHVNFPVYSKSTWVPTLTGITQVGATSNTFNYVKIGKIVFFEVTLQAATSTAATAGSAVITTPTTPAVGSTCTAVNIGTSASLGVGSVFPAAQGILPPTISVGAGIAVYISGFYTE